MSYLTMEAEINNGRIIPSEPDKLPVTGRALLTVLTTAPRPDVESLKGLFGALRLDSEMNAAKWQQQLRSEWNR